MAVGTIPFSFCNPSLRPTSTIFTYSGSDPKNCKMVQKIICFLKLQKEKFAVAKSLANYQKEEKKEFAA